MRICLCTDTYLPEVNGVTTVLDAMRCELVRRGHSIFIIAPAYGIPENREVAPTDEDSPILRLASIPCPGYRQVHLSWPWGRGLSGAIDRYNPHLVHAVTEGPIGLFGRQYARRHRLPLASSFHTDFPRYAREYLGEWAVGPTRAWLRRFHSVAALTMTPSERTRKELAALGVPAPTLWGRGVDTGRFNPGRRSAARRNRRGGDGRVHVLHVGRLASEKGVETLVSAFRQAHAALGATAVFCVAGE